MHKFMCVSINNKIFFFFLVNEQIQERLRQEKYYLIDSHITVIQL
jgi:hypothetical protein